MVSLSVSDVALSFCYKRSLPPIKPEDVVAEVVMSPQHAKSLMIVLQQNIADYERIFGTINLEPNMDALKDVQSKAEAIAKAQGQVSL